MKEWKLPTVKNKAIFTPETNAATPLSMPQALSHATSGMSKDSVMKNVTTGGPIKNFESGPHKSAFDKWVKELKAKNP